MGKTSNGMRSSIHARQEAKRQAKFAEKRAIGAQYVYKKNPYKEGSDKWDCERVKRLSKVNKHYTSISGLRSIMQKLENELTKKSNENKAIATDKKVVGKLFTTTA